MSDIISRLRNHAASDITAELLNEAADNIERLLAEQEASSKWRRLREDQILIKQLIAERDAARQEICLLDADTAEDQIEYAQQRGWDCFKKAGNEK